MKKRILFEALIAVAIIVLVFMLYIEVSGSAPAIAVKWTTAGNERVNYIYADEDGTLYSFAGNTISAIDTDGNILWNLTIPYEYNINNGWMRLTERGPYGDGYLESVSRIVTSDNGTLYVMAIVNDTSTKAVQDHSFSSPLTASVIAISRDGSILWTSPVEGMMYRGYGRMVGIADLYSQGGRIFAFYGYNETVLAANGTTLFSVEDVSDPAAVDEEGYIYLVKAETTIDEEKYYTRTSTYFRKPSDTIEAYSPDGRLYWSRSINEPVYHQYIRENIRQEFGTLPVYRNNSLYVPLQNGILTMCRDGTINWLKRLDINVTSSGLTLFELMPFDEDNNVYLKYVDYGTAPDWDMESCIYIISPDGKNVSPAREYDETHSARYVGARDGILYYVDTPDHGEPYKPAGLDDLQTIEINAYDLKEGRALWSYTIPVYNRKESVICNDNFMDIFPLSINSYFPYHNKTEKDTWGNNYANVTLSPISMWKVDVLPGEDMVYTSFYNFNYEDPIVFDRSGCVYVTGIYALDLSGKPVWQKLTDSPIVSMTEKNGMIYYSTQDGRISATKIDLATGFAVAAAAYVFIRFFLVGALSRAKSRLDKNENRKKVLRYIEDNPGTTLYEISRGTGMNLGTVRYHMLILSLHHKIVSCQVDEKYVRFFTNSNTFSKEEQTVLSLMRRDSTRKVLSLLAEKPGLTNVELSRRLDIAQSMMSKYIKELYGMGIITREQVDGGRYGYCISNEYKDHVSMAMERLKYE